MSAQTMCWEINLQARWKKMQESLEVMVGTFIIAMPINVLKVTEWEEYLKYLKSW